MPYGDYGTIAELTETVGEFQEGLTKYCAVIQSDHSYIHQGIGYGVTVETSAISASGVYKFSFTTSSEHYIHWRPAKLESTADLLKFELYEGGTISGAGSNVSIFNHNRLSSNVSGMSVARGVTASTTGLEIPVGFFVGSTAGSGAGSASKSGGSIDGSAEEWVLKRNQVYIATVTNRGGSDTIANATFFWYEEGGGLST